MKIGIIGCGKIFPMHVYSIKAVAGVRLCAIADTSLQKMQYWAQKLGVEGYLDYKEMIRKENLDAVHICTPHYLHAEMAIYALNKGLHVLTEKPAAITQEDAIKMLEAKKKNNRALVVSFQNRFNESSNFVRDEFNNQAFGEFLAGKAQLTWNRSETYYKESGWKGTWDKEGGGLIIDQAIHTLDLISWILGTIPSVTESFLANWFHPNIEVEDTAQVILECFDGKKIIFYGNNFYYEDSPVIVELLFENAKVVFNGDQVTVTYNNGKEVTQKPSVSDIFNIEGHKQYWGTSHLKQIRHFYKELSQGNVNPKNTLEDCIGTQNIVDNIYKKAEFSKFKRK